MSEAIPQYAVPRPAPERHTLELVLDRLEQLRDELGADAGDGRRLSLAIAEVRATIRSQLSACQLATCNAAGMPMFMPATGFCYRCGADLLGVLQLGRPQAPITGCPACHVSYCD